MLFFGNRAEAEQFDAFSRIDALADVVRRHIPAYSGRTAIRYDDGKTYRAVSFAEYSRALAALVPFFSGFESKIVATFCKNRPEWDYVALATFYTGNILFPLDTKTNDRELAHLLQLSPPDYVLTTFAQRGRLHRLCDAAGIAPVFLLADLAACYEDSVAPGETGLAPAPGEVGLAACMAPVGVPALAGIPPNFRLKAGLQPAPSGEPLLPPPSPALDDPGRIVARYPTSGTTSPPKVVQITNGAVVAEINEAIDVINLRPNEEVLNIGPYTHIATLVEFLVTKTRGFPVTYFTREPDEDDVLEDEIRKLKNQGVRIKTLMAAPKFWIYLLKEVLEEMKNKPVLENLYRHLSAIERNDRLHDIGTLDKAKLAAMRTRLRNKLGGYFSYGGSSSTKLDGSIVEIFGKLGITVVDIYGATEVTGIIARNRLNDVLPGSCGRLIDCLEYRLRDVRPVPGAARPVGELLVRGPTLLHSYVGAEPGSALTEDGYYATGDLAWVDDDRRVWLLGRERELIRWSDGSFIDPQHLSNLLVRSIFVKDAMVMQRHPDDPYLSVFLYPDRKRIAKDPRWKKLVDAGLDEAALLKNLMVEAIEYAESVARISAPLRKDVVYILPRLLERTPTHKIKFLFERERIHEAVALTGGDPR
jgi:long-subunit acyl-CoA synthetase (AMP-forming)